MASIFDVADWFLAKDRMTHKKLQKLCYYAVAWSWAIYPEPPIADAEFEAWVHGPVCSALYDKYKSTGFGYIQKGPKPDGFTEEEEDFLEDVWVTYGHLSANSLEALSHSEAPWEKARAGLDPAVESRLVISSDDMRDYYRSIYSLGDA